MQEIGMFLGLVKAIFKRGGEPASPKGPGITNELWGAFKRRVDFIEQKERFIAWIRRNSSEFAADPGLISDFFQLKSATNVSFVLGNAHPQYDSSDVHPSHVEGMLPFRTFLGRTLSRAQLEEFIMGAETVSLRETARIDAFLHKHIIVFGGPTSNHLPQLLFGWRKDKPKQTLLPNQKPAFTPRFEFILDEERIRTDFPDGQQFTVTRNGALIPNWALYDTLKKRPLIPLIANNIVTKDYLLLTRMPNIFDRGKSTVLSIAGTHGLGTSATELLFNDNKTLRFIQSQTSKLSTWQAVIPVQKATGHQDFTPGAILFDDIVVTECDSPRSELMRTPAENRNNFLKLLSKP